MDHRVLHGTSGRELDRRHLLMAGGAAAAVAAAGATVLGAGPASAAPLVPVPTPVDPVRLYDSREPGALGRISAGMTDTLTSSPATALAFLLNVTVVNTTGWGWISVFSADLESTDASTVNWYGPDQVMVNTSYTWIRASDSGIRVSCGGGSTQYVLDLTGILFMFDAGAAAASLPASVGSSVPGDYSAVRS